MKSNFEAAMAHVFEFEGGYVNHPKDPGGATNFGISQRAYPELNVRTLTEKQAKAIYRRDYWDAVRGDDLPGGVDLVVFDAAVNSGVSRSSRWLQKAVGAKEDGRIGPRTLSAVKAMDATNVINRAVMYRLDFLQGLRNWRYFGKGWQRRVDTVRGRALDLPRVVPQPQINPLLTLLRALAALFTRKA